MKRPGGYGRYDDDPGAVHEDVLGVMGELDSAARRLDRFLTHSLIGMSGRFHPWGRFYPSGGTRTAKPTLLTPFTGCNVCRVPGSV